jgi:carbamoyl-phosphate synthase large subunit
MCNRKYWAAMQSTMNFRVPEPGEGILLGGDIDKSWLTTVVDSISPLGYKFFCASPEVKSFLEQTAKGNIKVQLIDLPLDKMGIRSAFSENDIRAVFNLCSARAKVWPD